MKTKRQLPNEGTALRERVAEPEAGEPEQHGAVETLFEGEQKYRRLFEESRDAIFVLSRREQDVRITDANPAMEELFGYAREEIVGLDIRDLWADLAERAKFLEEFGKTGSAKDYPVRLRRMDGAVLDCLLTSNVWRDPEGHVIGAQGIIRDITQPKRVEEALLSSERRYSRLFEDSRDAIYILASGPGGEHLVDVNQSWVELLGYSREEAPQLNLQQVWIDAAEQEGFLRTLAAEGSVRDHEVRLRTKGGAVKNCLLTISLLRDDQGRVVGRQGTIRDITRRKLAEERERLRARALEVVSIIAGHLAKPGTFEERIDRVLQELARLTAANVVTLRLVDPESGALWVGGSAGKARPATTAHSSAQGISGLAFDLGEPVVVNNYPAHPRARPATVARGVKSAAAFPVQSAGRVLGAVVIDAEVFDYFTPERVQLVSLITEGLGVLVEGARLQEAERLRTGELEALFHVARILAEGGTFEGRATRVLEELRRVGEAHSVALRLADQDQQELRLVAVLGESLRRGLSPVHSIQEGLTGLAFREGRPVVANDYPSHPEATRVAAAADTRSALALPIRAGGSKLGTVVINATEPNHFTPDRVRLLNAVADGIGTLLENANLHERERLRTKELEETLEQLRTTQQQLIQSDRLATLGQLVAGVAHEVNNPLTGALMHTQLLLRQPLDEAVKSDVEIIQSETHRAVKIMQNLLSFARQHTPVKSCLSINEVLERTMELRAYELGVNGIQVVLELQPDLPQTLADFHQLQQVFLNIIVNAEQAMVEAHGRGRLHIKTSRVDQAIRVGFTDDGPGIPREHLSRVFDPFFTTKEPGEGTGLGLSICYGIVQEHRGRIWVESIHGQGATFTVEIPVINEENGS